MTNLVTALDSERLDFSPAFLEFLGEPYDVLGLLPAPVLATRIHLFARVEKIKDQTYRHLRLTLEFAKKDKTTTFCHDIELGPCANITINFSGGNLLPFVRRFTYRQKGDLTRELKSILTRSGKILKETANPWGYHGFVWDGRANAMPLLRGLTKVNIGLLGDQLSAVDLNVYCAAKGTMGVTFHAEARSHVIEHVTVRLYQSWYAAKMPVTCSIEAYERMPSGSLMLRGPVNAVANTIVEAIAKIRTRIPDYAMETLIHCLEIDPNAFVLVLL